MDGQKAGYCMALLLLLSGAFANVVDRFINRAVTDYVDFFLGIYHWPAFNLADVWITFGVIGVIAVEFVLKQRDTKHLEMEG